MLYEKFGELNSAQEINELAENLFNENDIESLKELAKENGLSDMVNFRISAILCRLRSGRSR